MIRLAILSFWHVHAKDYAAEAESEPGVELAAIWDDDEARGRDAAKTWNVAFVASLAELLADPSIDGIVLTSATVQHVDLINAVFASGKHLFAEKVIAPTLTEATAIVRSLPAGCQFAVALSRSRNPAVLAMRELIQSERIGEVASARVRMAHGGRVSTPDQQDGWLGSAFLDPRQAGGGAMIDLGAHPLYIARVMLGMPQSVSATYGRINKADGEDNAAVLLGYDNGRYAIAETSFMTAGSPFALEVHGARASATYDERSNSIVVSSTTSEWKRDWSEIVVERASGPTPFQRWVRGIENGTSEGGDLELAIELSALAEAANRSAGSGRTIRLNELDGWADYQRWSEA